MRYTVYIIFSPKLNKYYVGSTEDIVIRLYQHNEGISTFTSKASDWKLMYTEHFDSRNEALSREYAIKKKKSRKYIEWLIAEKK